MDKSLTSLDWALVRAFLIVAETGSLSAAARRLGASQPTLGRQIRQLNGLYQVSMYGQIRCLFDQVLFAKGCQQQDGDEFWQPSALLERLVAEGKNFADLNS